MDANNIWTGIGNLGSDPVLRQTNSGDSVCNFRIAVDRSYRQGDRTVNVTNWIPVVAWRQDAEHYARWLKKGSQVAVTGRLETRSWEDADGNRHYAFEIVASDVKFLANIRGRDDIDVAETAASVAASA